MKPMITLAATAVMAASVMASSGVATGDRVNWDAVAQCESGDNWSANTGNGLYGGLQISPATWRANGGTGSPATAPRGQQIQVAQRILAHQGPDAWPSCLSQGRDRGVAKVGSVTHLLTYLIDQAQAAAG